MTFSAHLTPASKAELLQSTSSLALASAEVQKYTVDVSTLVKNIIENPEEVAANNNKAPIAQAA